MTKGLWARCPKTGFFGELFSVLEITGGVRKFYWVIRNETYTINSIQNDVVDWVNLEIFTMRED